MFTHQFVEHADCRDWCVEQSEDSCVQPSDFAEATDVFSKVSASFILIVTPSCQISKKNRTNMASVKKKIPSSRMNTEWKTTPTHPPSPPAIFVLPRIIECRCHVCCHCVLAILYAFKSRLLTKRYSYCIYISSDVTNIKFIFS